MKEKFDKLIDKKIKAKEIDNLGIEFQTIADMYNVSYKTVYNRFNSMFQDSAKNIILKAIYPSKEELISLLLNTTDSKDFFNKLDLPTKLSKGIFDKEWGVSTYHKAKLLVLTKRLYIPYNRLREDNRSLWYSQLLGDGSYNKQRHAFTIVHGLKQTEYLKWKVSLINKAYPKTPTEVALLKHSQGHMYARYYSRNIGNIDIPEDRGEVIPKLTPLGWLLWWLDDGGWYQNITIFSIDKSIIDRAIIELNTYDIKARHSQNGMSMCGHMNDLKFYKNFIEPFLNNIPKCMLYKVKI